MSLITRRPSHYKYKAFYRKQKNLVLTIKLIKKNHKLLYGGFEPTTSCVTDKLILFKIAARFLKPYVWFIIFQKKVDDKPMRHHYWGLRSYPTPSVRHTPEWNPCIIYLTITD